MSAMTFDVQEYAIGGKMVTGRVSIPELDLMDSIRVDALKEKLVHDLVHHILENKLAEFTSMDDPINFTKNIAVRMYLAPNDHIKILRSQWKP
jgi:hypothetical protein